jgi:hypothetical protein
MFIIYVVKSKLYDSTLTTAFNSEQAATVYKDRFIAAGKQARVEPMYVHNMHDAQELSPL